VTPILLRLSSKWIISRSSLNCFCFTVTWWWCLIEILSNPWILFLPLEHSYFPGTMFVKVDAPHHSNCSLKLNWSSDLSMHVYDNHYFEKHLEHLFIFSNTCWEKKMLLIVISILLRGRYKFIASKGYCLHNYQYAYIFGLIKFLSNSCQCKL